MVGKTTDRHGRVKSPAQEQLSALDEPGGRLLAVWRTGQAADLHLHQQLGGKRDHIPQTIGVRGLLDPRAQVHHGTSSLFLPSGSSVATQTYREITVTTSTPSYTTTWDTIGFRKALWAFRLGNRSL
jgi:hypothetical protein